VARARSRWRRHSVVVAALAWAGLLFACGSADYVERGSAAPDFTLERLDGGALSLSDLRGRVVLINFWATWCEPCKEEMPAMERLYQAHREAGFELVAISVGEEPEPVRAFRDQIGFTFPVLLDPDRVAANAYQTHRFPESFLVDAEGVVVERYIGPKTWDHEAYRERVGRLIAGDDIR